MSNGTNTQKVEIPIPREIYFQFLKELPAKYLLRFRCVSKLWRSIIDDPLFIDLHRARSHTRPGGTTILVQSHSSIDSDASEYDFFSLKPEGGSPVFLETFHSKNPYLSLRSVDGLVCLGNVVWNPTTRESIKLPPLNVSRDLDLDFDLDSDYYTTNVCFGSDYSLGFAPSTMQYKVVNRCDISITKIVPDSTNEIETRLVCKILTIGDSLWRDIDTDPLQEEFHAQSSFCINGTIYWFASHTDRMLALDVALEKFGWISLPNGEDIMRYSIQVGERVAVININLEKIWMLDDTGCWNMETMVIPNKYKDNRCNCLTPVGTIHDDKILVQWEYSELKLFYCDPYNKTFRRILYPGLPETFHVYGTSFAKHVECLFRLEGRN